MALESQVGPTIHRLYTLIIIISLILGLTQYISSKLALSRTWPMLDALFLLKKQPLESQTVSFPVFIAGTSFSCSRVRSTTTRAHR